jgi:hypothetical protein
MIKFIMNGVVDSMEKPRMNADERRYTQLLRSWVPAAKV